MRSTRRSRRCRSPGWRRPAPIRDKLNVNGGAIALGHPLGASGAKLMATLTHALKARGLRYGLQTMCEGGGIANVTIVENLRARYHFISSLPRLDPKQSSLNSPRRNAGGSGSQSGATKRNENARRIAPAGAS